MKDFSVAANISFLALKKQQPKKISRVVLNFKKGNNIKLRKPLK